MAKFGFAEAPAKAAVIPRWTIGLLFCVGYVLTLVGWGGRECGIACNAGQGVAGFLEWYVFPYSLFWALVPAVHAREVSNAIILAVGIGAYLALRRLVPPKLSVRQFGVVLGGWALLCVALLPLYLVAFHLYYGTK
ncbi:hypothetical protein [Phenylobacterium sp.]|uniref:hypothetical protein n=1 Tax=Phenylobacterium sp. TaxID=1871053 RepID=UPI00272772E5|nr:hypothetical protein [Phenylobacterium sp.]MDO8379031.1 hypothetical protein [Phenylobacterium sp.]